MDRLHQGFRVTVEVSVQSTHPRRSCPPPELYLIDPPSQWVDFHPGRVPSTGERSPGFPTITVGPFDCSLVRALPWRPLPPTTPLTIRSEFDYLGSTSSCHNRLPDGVVTGVSFTLPPSRVPLLVVCVRTEEGRTPVDTLGPVRRWGERSVTL